MGELNILKENVIEISREEINEKIKNLEQMKYKVPSVKLINIPFRGYRKQIKVINYDRKKPNLDYVIKRLGRIMMDIDECTIIIKNKKTFIKIKGRRKIIVKEMKTKFGDIELNEKVRNGYEYNHPIIGSEDYQFEGNIYDMKVKYVVVDNNFNIIEEL